MAIMKETIRTEIENFLNKKTLAIVGVSRNRKKFSNKVYRDLKSKGYQLFIVNPNAESIENERCYPNLTEIPEKIDRVLIMVPRSETEKVIQDAIRSGISHIMIQQGAESEKAINLCKEKGIDIIAGECVLMFAEPTAFYHRIHRWIWNLT